MYLIECENLYLRHLYGTPKSILPLNSVYSSALGGRRCNCFRKMIMPICGEPIESVTLSRQKASQPWNYFPRIPTYRMWPWCFNVTDGRTDGQLVVAISRSA